MTNAFLSLVLKCALLATRAHLNHLQFAPKRKHWCLHTNSNYEKNRIVSDSAEKKIDVHLLFLGTDKKMMSENMSDVRA